MNTHATPSLSPRAVVNAGQSIFNVKAAILFILFTIACQRPLYSQLTRWTLSEFQPRIANGGRANTFSVHPTNNNSVLVASETGGLFRSTDQGVHWQHVDNLPCFSTNSVAYLPLDPNKILATTNDDFKTSGGGGIWRSTDGGINWTQATIPLPPGISGRMSAYEISIAPGGSPIYVATLFGVVMSSDQGLTWTFQDPFGGGDRRTFSVLALGSNVVLAGGPAGVRRSINGGTSWTTPTSSPGGIGDMHAFGRSPLSSQQAFVVNGATMLFRTEDGGANWMPIASAPAGGGACGGICFVKAVRGRPISPIATRVLQLYFGNRCGVYRLTAAINTAGIPVYTGTWTLLVTDHGDTRDLAVDNGSSPVLLASDGGIHKTSNGGANWTYAGGGANGYNALQITEVRGQYINDIARQDLYFGTQDNDLWSSGTMGASWTDGMCCEGFFIENEKRISTATQSKVTNVTCGDCLNVVSGALFTARTVWPNPSGDVAGNPMLVQRSQHLQGVNTSGGFTKGLAFSTDLGVSWRQYATFPEDRRDLPKLGRPGSTFPTSSGPRFLPSLVYQAYRAPGWNVAGNFEINHLLRIRKTPTSTTATVYYATMNNFGGLGINPTMFAWYQVYGVDPGNPMHLIAPDVVNQQMMETRDGGDNWTPLPELTNLATDGGRLLFRNGIFPLITTVSFSPQNPDLVLAGSSEGGIYVSSNNGTNWTRIDPSSQATYITSFYWRTANDVIVSTYGRGLWRLQNRFIVRRVDFEHYCKPCFILSVRPNEPDPPFDRAILVFEGRVMGARSKGQVLQEVFVSPGSSYAFTSESEKQVADIKVTLTTKAVGFNEFPAFQSSPRGGIMKGLVFGKENKLTGAVFGEQEAAMYKAVTTQDSTGQTKSPSAGKPYMTITTRRYDGAPVAAPDEVMTVTGVRFPKNTVLFFAFDDDSTRSKLQVGADGNFKLQIRAPKEFGIHRLLVRTGQGQKDIIDGSMFFVRHIDEFKKENKPQKPKTYKSKPRP